jgi:glycosyltransferase involved in cell wall biosynthesis
MLESPCFTAGSRRMSIFSEKHSSPTHVERRLRVLQLGKYYYPYMGGIENHLYLLCNELKHEVDLDVLVCNARRASTTDSVEGVNVRRCFELAKLASASICPTMPLELSRREYDVVHFHFPHPMGVMSYQLARHSHRHAVVVTYHSDIVRQVNLLKAYRPFMDRLLARADAILCTSPDYMEGSDALGRLRHKCHVVPYGINTSQFEPSEAIRREARSIRARFGDRPLVLAVGRLIYYKGFEYVIRAMREVDAELAIVGEGPLRSSLEAIAREMAIAHRVHFIGEVHNLALAPWYHACDVYALPSIARSEAFAIVQLEAMVCGKPVVNTAIPRSGVPFVSRGGESGLTVPPADSQSFGRALRTILADEGLARRMGEAGQARVKREFSKEVMAGRVKEIYRHVTRI